ncbi:MAG TPA: CapA family protein [Bacteroidales bacterium]|nr:CapA family protein [Bacteroidales bacterium]HQK71450.1 CapA family protein [Bacteroidales bacterium]
MKKIVFTGDIALSGIISNFSEADSAEKLSISKFTDGGLAIINLEAPVAEEDAISNKRNGVVLRSSLNAMESFLIHNRIAAVTLANNHSLDYGFEGIKETISILDSFNIPHTGAGYLKEHLEPAIFKVEDTGYALLGYVHPDTNPFLEEGLSLNVYERERIIDSVRQSRKLADRVIVSLHWGRDYSKFPLPWQIEDAHIFIEAGADLVVGHHPHVIQPFEIYRGSYIFYSLGSTVFGDFYLRNRLRALPVKTKRSFVPLFTDLKEEPVFVPLRELKGNKLVVESGDIRKWSVRMMKWMRLKHRCRILSVIIDFKEKWVDKIWDVITGYYRNPFKDLFSREALKNAGRIMVGKDRMR